MYIKRLYIACYRNNEVYIYIHDKYIVNSSYGSVGRANDC